MVVVSVLSCSLPQLFGVGISCTACPTFGLSCSLTLILYFSTELPVGRLLAPSVILCFHVQRGEPRDSFPLSGSPSTFTCSITRQRQVSMNFLQQSAFFRLFV